MHWRVAANVYVVTHNASLRVTPEASRNFLASTLYNEAKSISFEKGSQNFLTYVVDSQDIRQSVSICFNTTRTRLSTIASRSSSCSCALPNTSVSLYV